MVFTGVVESEQMLKIENRVGDEFGMLTVEGIDV